MKHIKLFEEFINEFGGHFTKEYDGFIILDVKDQKAYKFRYIKGTKGVKAEDEAIAKVMQKTGKPRNAFMVHGSIKKREFDKTDTHPNFGPIKIKLLESLNRGKKLIAKKPNELADIDIDFAGTDADLRKLSKKYNLEADEYDPGQVTLSGKKKDILAYLQSVEYDMDAEDIQDLFPEVLE